MTLDKDELAAKIKELLKPEVTKISYDTWILPLNIRSIEEDHIVFTANSEFQKDFLENKYRSLLFNTLRYITNKDWTFSVIDLSKEENENISTDVIKDENNADSSAEVELNKSTLNPKYTFDTFVVGNNNRFAHAAALAVGNEPAKSYNPLFLYGGVGLGKTHLMHAIGNRIVENNRNSNVLYVTSEKFTNQLINAIKDNKNEFFRNKYRNIDVLLIDDIQFIAGKERVQEEFFHTFNSLYEDGKQIIISSDKPPRDIQFLEDRLKSRFEWGLLADISCPDYETRLAILRKKAQDENIIIDDFILSNIANKIDSNIRELEGVFNKIVARASLTHSPITIELAENIINEFKYESEKVISCDFIKETVSKYFSINKDDLSGNKRSNDIAFPRQIAMYLCREVANMSYPQIGIDFGGRDHSTVMHACRKIEKEIKEKNNTKLIVDSVKNIIINGKDTTYLKPKRIPFLRRSMGVVFQDFRLLPDRTVYDNVAYAMYIVRATPRHIRRQVPMVLSLVGLSGKAKMYPNELSGGEQQRVALARALVNNPSMLIADEPTGNLDPDTAWDIMTLLNDINMRGTTVVVATHAKDIVDKMKKRVIHVRKGEIIKDDKKGGYEL